MLDKSLQDSLRRIAKFQDLQFRQTKIILADFIATDERKIDYMDQYMDTLLDFMEPESETEMLIRKYEEEKQEMKTALNLLNKNNCVSRKEYIDRIAGNRLALKVKLNDLKSNMDISRIPNPTARDFKRLERYQKEYSQLLNALS